MQHLMIYAPAFPEILLAVAAMVLLMIGAFSDDNDHNGAFIGWLSIAVMIDPGHRGELPEPRGWRPRPANRSKEYDTVSDAYARFRRAAGSNVMEAVMTMATPHQKTPCQVPWRIGGTMGGRACAQARADALR